MIPPRAHQWYSVFLLYAIFPWKVIPFIPSYKFRRLYWHSVLNASPSRIHLSFTCVQVEGKRYILHYFTISSPLSIVDVLHELMRVVGKQFRYSWNLDLVFFSFFVPAQHVCTNLGICNTGNSISISQSRDRGRSSLGLSLRLCNPINCIDIIPSHARGWLRASHSGPRRYTSNYTKQGISCG